MSAVAGVSADDPRSLDDPRFARIPIRLLDELESGQLSFAGLALRVYLIGRTSHHTSRHQTTLAAMRDLVAWPWGDQKLRNELRDLEPDFRAESGQGRNRWVFHVQADDFGLNPAELHTDFTPETPSDFEVASNGAVPAEAANAAVMRARGEVQLHTGAAPQPSTAETSSAPGAALAQPGASRARDELSGQTPADAAAVKSADALTGADFTGRANNEEYTLTHEQRAAHSLATGTCIRCGSDHLTARYKARLPDGKEIAAYLCDEHAPPAPERAETR
jgi:hypothetical protein